VFFDQQLICKLEHESWTTKKSELEREKLCSVIYIINLILFAFCKAIISSVVQSINARKKSSVFIYRCNTRVIYGIPIFSQWIVRFCKKRSILNSCGSTCMKYQVLFKVVVCKVLRAHFSTFYCCSPHYFLATYLPLTIKLPPCFLPGSCILIVHQLLIQHMYKIRSIFLNLRQTLRLRLFKCTLYMNVLACQLHVKLSSAISLPNIVCYNHFPFQFLWIIIWSKSF
jgi:hypothetical protein